jgi:hypothetical protein
MTILMLRTISLRPRSIPKVSAFEGVDDSGAITKRAIIKRFLYAGAWFAAGTILLAALDGAEARSGSRQTQRNATATTPGTTNPPRRPTIPNTNGPVKRVCGGYHHPC